MKINGTQIELVQGDITEEEADAIVNAANSGLAGGGGVDGAIHRAGGPQIMAACRKIGRCATGEAVVTSGGNLKSRFVIHAVGPVYHNGISGEPALLAQVYRNVLKRAAANDVRTLAIPSISTGAYRYPVRDAAKIALSEVARFVSEERHDLQRVRFVLFDDKTLAIYQSELEKFESKPE